MLIALAALGLSRWGQDRWRDVPSPLHEPPLAEGDYAVLRVVDGDTLLLSPQTPSTPDARREIRVRLLGVDCPESVKPDHPVEPWALQAAAFTRQFLDGGRVQLRFDKRRLDRYDRYLAYAFVADKMLNEELLRAGLARVSIYPGDSDSMARRLRAAAAEAEQARRGLWSQ